MDEKQRFGFFGIIAGIAGTLVILAAIAVAAVYAGAYGVAATEEHASFVRWGLDTNFHNAVENAAEDVAEPEEITAAMVEAGAHEYRAMCEHCHAGPGVERAEWASGMRPRPPHMTEAAAEWELEEIFWIAKHGARMTGMPAFGPSHDDETLWGIAAFVKKLPAMSPQQYAASGGEEARTGGSQEGGHGSGS